MTELQNIANRCKTLAGMMLDPGGYQVTIGDLLEIEKHALKGIAKQDTYSDLLEACKLMVEEFGSERGYNYSQRSQPSELGWKALVIARAAIAKAEGKE